MPQTNKQAMINAMECTPAAQKCPIWEIEFHLYDKFGDGRLVLGHEFEKLSAAEQEAALHANVDVMLSVAAKLNFAAVTTISGYWEVAPGVPAYYWLPKDARDEFLRLLRKTGGDDLFIVAEASACVGMPGAANYLDFSYLLYDDPDQIDVMAAQRLAAGIERIGVLADMGVDAVMDACDVADNHGVFYNPEHFDRFFLPYLAKWAAAARAAGCYSILHTDGNISDIIEKLAATPLNALQALDPIAGVDIYAEAERVRGRLCLCGNVDVGVIHFGPAARVCEETTKLCEFFNPRGGFALGASNAVFQDCPAENYQAMIDAWESCGR